MDIFPGIHENVFPWQPTPIVNKATFYQFLFQISVQISTFISHLKATYTFTQVLPLVDSSDF